jgi:integrase
VSLSKARTRRDAARDQVKAGIDPLDARDRQRAAETAAREKAKREAVTFRQVAEQFIDAKEAGWRNPKHRAQWRSTLEQYAYPALADLSVAHIETEQVLEALRPIWTEKTETAKRVQGRIESVLDYARAQKLRERENPARWRGHLDKLLPKPGDVAKVTHQRALPFKDAPALAKAMQDADTPASRALLLTLLCATRTSETIEARWDEFDLEAGLWCIPAARMKAGKEHRIPLPAAAVAILRRQEAARRDQWVFPGQKRGKCLSNMAMTNALKRAGWLDRTTVHGLRSTFRDWAGERTSYPERLAEVALAHQLTDKAQKAYWRGDLMEQRRQMMDAWAKYLAQKPGKVVDLPTGKKA